MFKTIIFVIILFNITASNSSDLNEEKIFKLSLLTAEVKPVTPGPPLRGTWHWHCTVVHWSRPPEQQTSWRTRNQADVAIMSRREMAPAPNINGALEYLPTPLQCPGTLTLAILQFAMTASPSMCLDSIRGQATFYSHELLLPDLFSCFRDHKMNIGDQEKNVVTPHTILVTVGPVKWSLCPAPASRCERGPSDHKDTMMLRVINLHCQFFYNQTFNVTGEILTSTSRENLLLIDFLTCIFPAQLSSQNIGHGNSVSPRAGNKNTKCDQPILPCDNGRTSLPQQLTNSPLASALFTCQLPVTGLTCDMKCYIYNFNSHDNTTESSAVRVKNTFMIIKEPHCTDFLYNSEIQEVQLSWRAEKVGHIPYKCLPLQPIQVIDESPGIKIVDIVCHVFGGSHRDTEELRVTHLHHGHVGPSCGELIITSVRHVSHFRSPTLHNVYVSHNMTVKVTKVTCADHGGAPGPEVCGSRVSNHPRNYLRLSHYESEVARGHPSLKGAQSTSGILCGPGSEGNRSPRDYKNIRPSLTLAVPYSLHYGQFRRFIRTILQIMTHCAAGSPKRRAATSENTARDDVMTMLTKSSCPPVNDFFNSTIFCLTVPEKLFLIIIIPNELDISYSLSIGPSQPPGGLKTGSSQVDLDVVEATINKELDEEQGGITGYSNQDDLKDVKALQYPDNTAITICSYFLASAPAPQAMTRSPGGLSSKTIPSSWPSWRGFAINFLYEPGVSKNLSTGYIRPMMFHGLSSPSLPQEHWTTLLHIKTNDNVSRIPLPRQPTASAHTHNAVIFWITLSLQQTATVKVPSVPPAQSLFTWIILTSDYVNSLSVNSLNSPLPPPASENPTGSDLAPACTTIPASLWSLSMFKASLQPYFVPTAAQNMPPGGPTLRAMTSSTSLVVASPQPYLASTSQNRLSGGPTLRAMSSLTIMVVASPQPYLASTSQNRPSGGPTLRAMSSANNMASPQPYLASTSQNRPSGGPTLRSMTSSTKSGSDLAPAWPHLSSQTSSLWSAAQTMPSRDLTLRLMTSSTKPGFTLTHLGPKTCETIPASPSFLVVASPQPYLVRTSQARASGSPAWGTITSSWSNWIRIPWVSILLFYPWVTVTSKPLVWMVPGVTLEVPCSSCSILPWRHVAKEPSATAMVWYSWHVLIRVLTGQPLHIYIPGCTTSPNSPIESLVSIQIPDRRLNKANFHENTRLSYVKKRTQIKKSPSGNRDPPKISVKDYQSLAEAATEHLMDGSPGYFVIFGNLDHKVGKLIPTNKKEFSLDHEHNDLNVKAYDDNVIELNQLNGPAPGALNNIEVHAANLKFFFSGNGHYLVNGPTKCYSYGNCKSGDNSDTELHSISGNLVEVEPNKKGKAKVSKLRKDNEKSNNQFEVVIFALQKNQQDSTAKSGEKMKKIKSKIDIDKVLITHKKPHDVEPPHIMHQLTCNGVLEGIKICMRGFHNRMLYPDYKMRYSCQAEIASSSDNKTATYALMDKIEFDRERYRLGHTLVFFRAGALAKFEEARDNLVIKWVNFIQGEVLKRVCGKVYTAKRDQREPIKVAQRNFRKYLQMRDWGWLIIIQKTRAMIVLSNLQEELRLRKKKANETFDEHKAALDKTAELEGSMDNLKSEIAAMTKQLSEEQGNISVYTDSQAKTNTLKAGGIGAIKKDREDVELMTTKAETEKCNRDHTNRTLQDKIAEQDEVINKLNKEKKHLSAAQAKSNEVLMGAEEKVKDLSQVKSQLESTLDQLEGGFDKEKKARATIEKQKRKLEGDLKMAQDSIKDLKREKRDIENTSGNKSLVAKAQKNIKELQARVEGAQEELEAIHQAHSKAERQRSDLTLEVEQLSDRYDEASGATVAQVELTKKHEIIRLRKDVEETNIASESVLSNLKRKQGDSVLEMQEQTEALQKMKVKIDKDKQIIMTEIADARATTDEMGRSQASADKPNKNLLETPNAINKKLDAVILTIGDFGMMENKTADENGELLRIVGNPENSLNMLANAKYALGSQLNDVKAHCDNEARDRQLLLGKYRFLEHEVDVAKEALDEEAVNCENILRLNAKAEGDAAAMSQKYEQDAVAKAEELEMTKMKLPTRNTEADDTINNHNTKLAQAEKAKSKIPQEINEMTTNLDQAQVVNDAMERKAKQFEKTISEYKGKVDCLPPDLYLNQKVTRNAPSELLKVKSAYEETVLQLEEVRYENKTLSDEIKNIMNQITEGSRPIHKIDKIRKSPETETKAKMEPSHIEKKLESERNRSNNVELAYNQPYDAMELLYKTDYTYNVSLTSSTPSPRSSDYGFDSLIQDSLGPQESNQPPPALLKDSEKPVLDQPGALRVSSCKSFV